MDLLKLLVANRGEIAIRIIRAAADLGISTVAVHPADDAASLHTRVANEARLLNGRGAAAYLDIDAVVGVALETGCNAVHPGYGFLAENAAFARACEAAGLVFVGPTPEALELFGNKVAARELAARCAVPVLAGSQGATTLGEAEAFFAGLPAGSAVMVKALAGGGGRGMRAVFDARDLGEALERCAWEARAAFGNGDVFVEQLLQGARHIEVQVIGDGSGAVSHLWERECSVQRQRQKIVEVAPASGLGDALRQRLTDAAVRLASEVGYRSLGTVEFLVGAPTSPGDDTTASIAFLETNARVQVEHTVTEQVTGVDLVVAQLQIAGGASLAELGLRQADIARPRGFAVQARVNLETMTPEGTARPTGGRLATYDPPSGPSVRTDGYGYAGYVTNPAYDSLLAKVIGSGPTFAVALRRTERALAEFRIEGVTTNIGFLRAILEAPAVAAGEVHTRWVEDHIGELLATSSGASARWFTTTATMPHAPPGDSRAGVHLGTNDPLAVLAHGKDNAGPAPAAAPVAPPAALGGPEGSVAIRAMLQGTIVRLSVALGDEVAAGTEVAVMESMKMEHVIKADISGVVRQLGVAVGDTVFEGHPLLFVEEGDVSVVAGGEGGDADLDLIRPDLKAVIERHEIGLDSARVEAVAKRHKLGHRSARENLTQLVDPGSWIEYGPLVVAAQRTRRTMEDLIANTPADGMLAGIGSINGALFDEKATQTVVMSYDYTVLAGTQGAKNHYKKDRLMELALQWRLPVIFFAEGGGGRPGDVDIHGAGGLDILTFNTWGRLSGSVPMVGITNGRCFAGNAVILGCCDVVIATEGSNIGMGGPAMIEGGGLGVYRPEEVGPMDIQVPNGVVDIAVKDEVEAVEVARKYLSYFQGVLKEWTCADQRELRHIVPENRLRVYDVRAVIDTMFDTDSVLEIRRGFGLGMITAFARLEGKPVGIVANNPSHLGGAIDSDAADKATRFIQLCDAFDIPIVSLCDTPGNMVGPEYEKQALVRHCCRMFVTAANVTVPMFTIVLRKSYGLGAQGMAAGSFRTPFFAISWPTGEFGGMGLEGAVKLGFRKELEALEDTTERVALYDKLVARMYENGKALSTATYFEIDDVIDPAETRHWLSTGLKAAPVKAWRDRETKKRPCIDTW